MMIELVKDILEYNQTRDMGIWLSKHPWVVEDVESFGVMITDVLAWFRLGYKRELWKKDGKHVKQKPLEINLIYPWCNILKDITENDPEFLKYFYVSKNKLILEKQWQRKNGFKQWNSFITMIMWFLCIID